MKRRFPIIPTLLVALAVATMIALGFWQLGRAQWKNQLLEDYAAAANKSAIEFPVERSKAVDVYYFRKTKAYCYAPSDRTTIAGRNADKQSGLAHLVTCRSFDPSTSMSENQYRMTYHAVLGWSDDMVEPEWNGGLLTGTLMPDTQTGLRLVADPPVAGLQANETPNLDDIPNNHLAYAGQWFFFALVAIIIYILALRRRAKND